MALPCGPQPRWGCACTAEVCRTRQRATAALRGMLRRRGVVGGWGGSLPVAKNKAQGAGGGSPHWHTSALGLELLQASFSPTPPRSKVVGLSGCCHVEISWGETLHPFPRLVSMVIFHSTVFSRSEFISLQIRQPMLIYRSLGSISWQRAQGSYH